MSLRQIRANFVANPYPFSTTYRPQDLSAMDSFHPSMEIDNRAQNLSYGLGVGIRQVVDSMSPPASMDDLSTYSSWGAKFANWWLNRSSLHHAVEQQSLEAVDLFARNNKAAVNQFDARVYTPVHLAVLEDWPAGIKILQRHGADLNLSYSTAIKPLTLALIKRKFNALKALLDLGVDFRNTKSRIKFEVLDPEMIHHNLPFFNWLSRTEVNGKIIIEVVQSPLAIALMLSDIEAIDILRAKINECSTSSQSFSYSGFPELIKSCEYPLFSALFYTTDVHVLEHMIDKDKINESTTVIINDEAFEITSLMVAIYARNKHALKILLESGADLFYLHKIDGLEATPFAEIMKSKDDNLIQLALRHLPPDASNQEIFLEEEGETIIESPLSLAISMKDAVAFQHLIQNGAILSPDLFDRAMHNDNKEIQKLAIRHFLSLPDIDINQTMTDERGRKVSPLASVMLMGDRDIITALLKRGADPFQLVQLPNTDLTTPFQMVLDRNDDESLNLIFQDRVQNKASSLVYGPKPKNSYTLQFEMLIREIINNKQNISTIERINEYGRRYYNLVINGQEYDMYKLIANMDWEQIRLTEAVEGEASNFAESDKYADLTVSDVQIIKELRQIDHILNKFLTGETDEYLHDYMDPISLWLYSGLLANALNKIPAEKETHFSCFAASESDVHIKAHHPAFIFAHNNVPPCADYSNPGSIFFERSQGKDISGITEISALVSPPRTIRYSDQRLKKSPGLYHGEKWVILATEKKEEDTTASLAEVRKAIMR